MWNDNSPMVTGCCSCTGYVEGIVANNISCAVHHFHVDEPTSYPSVVHVYYTHTYPTSLASQWYTQYNVMQTTYIIQTHTHSFSLSLSLFFCLCLSLSVSLSHSLTHSLFVLLITWSIFVTDSTMVSTYVQTCVK